MDKKIPRAASFSENVIFSLRAYNTEAYHAFPSAELCSSPCHWEQKSHQKVSCKESIDRAKYLREEKSCRGSNEPTKESQSTGCCSLQLDEKG